METCRVEAAVCWDTLRAFTTHHQIGGSENVEGLGNQQATPTRGSPQRLYAAHRN